MKNLFSFDIISSDILCESFVAREISNELSERQDELNNEFFERVKKHMRPVKILKMLSCIFTFVFFVMLGVIYYKNESSLISTAKKYLWATIVGAVAFVATAFMSSFACVMNKRRCEYLYNRVLNNEFDEIYNSSMHELSVPTDCDCLDILALKVFDGTKRKDKSICYTSCEMDVFNEGDALCLTDEEKVIRIPFESILSLTEIQEKISFDGIWNKDTIYNKGRYEKYNIKYNKRKGCFYVPSYYSLKILDEKEFEILFPNYEEDIVHKYTNVCLVQRGIAEDGLA